MTQPQKLLLLVAVGDVAPGTLRDLEEPLHSQLGVATLVSKVALTRPQYAFNKDRGQYHTNAIMRRLQPLLETRQSSVLGVTDVDLFVPDSPFVFGEADRETRCGVLSVFRLREGGDGELARRRTQVEAVHQAGHLVGLSYCEDPRCAMFLAQSFQEADRKQLGLCNLCRNELQKLQR